MATRPLHERDEDCAGHLDADGTCAKCGVLHAGPCFRCGGNGFHRPGCLLIVDHRFSCGVYDGPDGACNCDWGAATA